MTSSSGVSASALVEKLELPPLRSLDDFALGSARFQLPNLQDLEKWGNRVVKNLLYYQTNYFGVFLVIYVFMILFNPTKLLCGLFVKTLIVAVFVQLFTDKGIQRSSKDTLRENRWLVLGGSLLGGYLLLLWFDAVLLSLFTILLPFCVTFIHASLRTRNIKNKVTNALDRPASTPMGKFLMAMNIIVENRYNPSLHPIYILPKAIFYAYFEVFSTQEENDNLKNWIKDQDCDQFKKYVY